MTSSFRKNNSPVSRSQQRNRFSLDTSNKLWQRLQPLDRQSYRLSPFKHPDPSFLLSERDANAMASWFDREDMDIIEADIHQCLKRLPTELLWDENLELF